MRTSLVLLLIAVVASVAESKLVQVSSLVRHGNRAPNAELVHSCPRLFPSLDAIFTMFGVRPQELTRAGLNQCWNIGKMLRHQYIEKEGFLRPDYTAASAEWFFHARGETRHQQTVAAIAMAMFPAGTGLKTFPDRLTPIPYFSWDKSLDAVLHPPKLCQACRFRDDARWTAVHGEQTVSKNMDKVNAISEVCGFNITSARVPSAALKDIADGFGFLTYEGLSIPGIPNWEKLSSMITQFSYDMFVERLFGTPEQATYWSGDFPRNLAANMLQMINRQLDNRGDPARKFLLYTASRELLFGVEHFFGLEFDIPAPSTPKGAMPPGDAMIFELHQADPTDGVADAASASPKKPSDQYFVRVYNMWPVNDPKKIRYDRQPYTIRGCTQDCPFEDFVRLIKEQEKRTGTWQDICSAYTFTDLAKEFPSKFGAGKPPGKHTPAADLIGPPPGEDDDLRKRYTVAELQPSKYRNMKMKPLGNVVRRPAAPVKKSDTPITTEQNMMVDIAEVEPEVAATPELQAVDEQSGLSNYQVLLRLAEEESWTPQQYAHHILGVTSEPAADIVPLAVAPAETASTTEAVTTQPIASVIPATSSSASFLLLSVGAVVGIAVAASSVYYCKRSSTVTGYEAI